MPLVQSLDLLKRRVTSPTFRRVLDDVHEKVRSGTALSDAFGSHADLFPRVYTASLLAGERSGNLDAVLRRYVEYTKIIATVKRKTVSALVYPAILVSLAVGLISIIVLKVVPAFSDFYSSFGADLPLVTRMIVRVSELIRSQFILMLVGLAPLYLTAGLKLGFAAPKPDDATFDEYISDPAKPVPYRARPIDNGSWSRWLVDDQREASGRPDVVVSLTDPPVIGRIALSVAKRHGARFVFLCEDVFPEVAVKMAEVGESTGALQDMLNTVADFYDEEISTTMERFVTLIEPVLLVFMGLVVAGLLLALYMPLFQLSSVLS